jgi:L-asparagine transporter-like permease
MVLKLYTYDVWQMDNISRISAFIALGIILLFSSFAFQRLKNIIKNMVDKKGGKNTENDGLIFR